MSLAFRRTESDTCGETAIMVCFTFRIANVKGETMLKPMFLGAALAVALSCQSIAGPLQDKTAEAEAALDAGKGGEAISLMREALFDQVGASAAG